MITPTPSNQLQELFKNCDLLNRKGDLNDPQIIFTTAFSIPSFPGLDLPGGNRTDSLGGL